MLTAKKTKFFTLDSHARGTFNFFLSCRQLQCTRQRIWTERRNGIETIATTYHHQQHHTRRFIQTKGLNCVYHSACVVVFFLVGRVSVTLVFFSFCCFHWIFQWIYETLMYVLLENGVSFVLLVSPENNIQKTKKMNMRQTIRINWWMGPSVFSTVAQVLSLDSSERQNSDSDVTSALCAIGWNSFRIQIPTSTSQRINLSLCLYLIE